MSAATAMQQVDKQTLILMQQLNKHVPMATDMHAMIEALLDYNNGNGVFYVVCADML